MSTQTLPKGWINRQIARLSCDAKHWPYWMKREVEARKAGDASSRREKEVQ